MIPQTSGSPAQAWVHHVCSKKRSHRPACWSGTKEQLAGASSESPTNYYEFGLIFWSTPIKRIINHVGSKKNHQTTPCFHISDLLHVFLQRHSQMKFDKVCYLLYDLSSYQVCLYVGNSSHFSNLLNSFGLHILDVERSTGRAWLRQPRLICIICIWRITCDFWAKERNKFYSWNCTGAAYRRLHLQSNICFSGMVMLSRHRINYDIIKI